MLLNMLFYPSKYPSGDWNPTSLDFEDVWFESRDGKRIHSWYCPCSKPRAYLLYFHGNAGNLSSRAEILSWIQSKLCVSVCIFDYRGFGRSEGKPTISGVLADARAAVEHFSAKVGVTEKSLVFMGRSLGGAIAIELAKTFQPKGLVIHSAFSSLKNIAADHYPLLSWFVPGWILNSKASIKNYRGHLLLGHAVDDQVVPFEHAKVIFDSANEPKSFVRIEKCSHNDPLPRSYLCEIDKFIGQLN